MWNPSWPGGLKNVPRVEHHTTASALLLSSAAAAAAAAAVHLCRYSSSLTECACFEEFCVCCCCCCCSKGQTSTEEVKFSGEAAARTSTLQLHSLLMTEGQMSTEVEFSLWRGPHCYFFLRLLYLSLSLSLHSYDSLKNLVCVWVCVCVLLLWRSDINWTCSKQKLYQVHNFSFHFMKAAKWLDGWTRIQEVIL